MRTDRELLELAAKAAGMGVWPGTGFQAHMLFTRPAKADPDGRWRASNGTRSPTTAMRCGWL